MGTPLSPFPFGTRRGTIFTYVLAGFYGFLISIVTLISLVFSFKGFFRTIPRPDKPKGLTDDRFGKHELIKLKNGLTIHYVTNSNPKNQLMLFLHGFPDCWYSWRHQLPVFSDKYYAVAVDMRGYGESDKPKNASEYSLYKLVQDTKEIIEALTEQGQKCILIGHDWGGLVALTTAMTHPELIERLVVMNAPTGQEWVKAMQTDWKQFFMAWYIFYFNLPYLPEKTISSHDFKAIEDLFQPFSKYQDIEVYKYYFSKGNGLTGPINYYRAFQRGIDYDFLREVHKNRITCPTLMIWGREDHALTTELAETSCKQCDNFTIKYIDNCSHWTQLDRPKQVNEFISSFLSNSL